MSANKFSVCHGKLIKLSATAENTIKKANLDLIIGSLLFIEKVGILLTKSPLISIIYPATKLRLELIQSRPIKL